jgi:phage terminase large subunit GpA-like protein
VAEDAGNHRPPLAGLEHATADDLRAELADTRSETRKLARQLDRAKDETRAWRDAYAVQGHLPCAHCGKPVKPSIRADSGWRHVSTAHESACAEIRPHRWSSVYPVEDIEPPEPS